MTLKNLGSFLAAALLALAAGDAWGQPVYNAPPMPPGTSVLGGYASLAVTADSARVALPASCPAMCALTVSNRGDKDAFFALGGSGVKATTSSTPVRAGKSLAFWVGTNTHIAAIAGDADSTSLDLYQGNGPVAP